ncbi:hypothetical protein DK842_22610 [Chromobacterium phragmitis]|nr:hypothetical protein DK842_22610 [Chromobacterium phragmitis]
MFQRVNHTLLCSSHDANIELLSVRELSNQATIHIEILNDKGVFHGAVATQLAFEQLDINFLLTHGTAEDVGHMLDICQRMARDILLPHPASLPRPTTWTRHLPSITELLASKWVLKPDA